MVIAAVTCTAIFSVGATAQAASDAGVGNEKSPVPDAELDAAGRVGKPGWDENAATPPTRLALVNEVIRADNLPRGVDGSGIGVALIDSGVSPVPGLDGAGKIVNGADLSFDSQAESLRYLDAYGHGTHMASIIAGNDGARRGFRALRIGDAIDDVAVFADQFPQRRAELNDDPLVEVLVAHHGDPERAPNRAARAVGGDHIARVDGVHVVADDVAQGEA